MDIKNPSKGNLRDVVASTKNFLTHLLVERTRKQQEISCNSLWGHFHIQLERASHHAKRLAEKRNRCRSNLASLAFLLFFIGLNVFSLLGRQSFASAAGSHSSSATLRHAASKSLATPPTDCSDPNNIETNQCFGGGDPGVPGSYINGEFILGSKCEAQLHAAEGNSICWNENDFAWGARDRTCLVVDTPSASERLDKFYKDFPGADFNFAPVSKGNAPSATIPPSTIVSDPSATVLASPTAVPYAPPISQPRADGYNQNSCVDGSICYSNNASNNDQNPDEHGVYFIHDQIGGDDITCYNKACIPGYTGDKGNTGSGNVCKIWGTIDRFACANLNINGHPSEWFYNPTAYAPPLMLEQMTAHFRTHDPFYIKASGNTPVCSDQHYWTCPSGEYIVVLLPQEGVTAGNFRVALEEGRFDGYPSVFAVFCNKPPSSDWIFPCSDIKDQPNIPMIQQDWLSGDIGKAKGSGHLAGTFLMDTLDKPELSTLFSNMLGLGYVLIAPFIILMGYQILYASWTFRHTVLLEALPRLLLSFVAISVSYQLARMLLDATNFLNITIINLHATSVMKYPEIVMGGHHYSYTLNGDDNAASFRGVVIPVSRWGCALNDFMKILGEKLLVDLAGYLPFVGGFIKFAGEIYEIVEIFRHIGEFIMLILSINLCAQIIMRIVLINYYILTGPIVFACWALPGGVGQKVLGQWTKGFLSLLFSQTAQIFVLTSLPLLMPVLPNFPQDKFGVINIFFKQLGPIITLLAVIHVPKMMGTEATSAIAQAGAVASGTVAAAGAVAYKTV